MEWSKGAIELPDGWRECVSEIARKAGNDKRGLTRYVWALAAYYVLTMDPDDLKAGAKIMRDIQEETPELLERSPDENETIRPVVSLEKWLSGEAKPRRRRYVESVAAELDQAIRRGKSKRGDTRPKRRSG